jgi:predicted site-specific integrase-resolvase
MKAASPRAAARHFSISDRTLRRWIAEGTVNVYAVGRRSVLFLEDLESVIRSQPAPKSSRSKYNTAEELRA